MSVSIMIPSTYLDLQYCLNDDFSFPGYLATFVYRQLLAFEPVMVFGTY